MQEKSCLHMSALGFVHNPSARMITGTDRVQGGLSLTRFEGSQTEQRPDNHGGDGEGTREPSGLVVDVDRGRS